MISRADHGLLVLDDEQGVPLVAQGAHDLEKLADITLVEADARFVHDEEGVHQRGAEAGGEIHALDLTTGEGLGGAVEREVSEADGLEVSQA